MRDLYKEGRLEFLLGGWSASDEACPTAEELIANVMAGHEFLSKEVGVEPPKVAWLLDSFGHSAATPELYQKLGFESLFFGRVNDAEKAKRKEEKALEFLWKPTFEGLNGPKNSTFPGMFTHITHAMYQGDCGIDLWIYQQDYNYMRSLFENKLADHKKNADTFVNCII